MRRLDESPRADAIEGIGTAFRDAARPETPRDARPPSRGAPPLPRPRRRRCGSRPRTSRCSSLRSSPGSRPRLCSRVPTPRSRRIGETSGGSTSSDSTDPAACCFPLLRKNAKRTSRGTPWAYPAPSPRRRTSKTSRGSRGSSRWSSWTAKALTEAAAPPKTRTTPGVSSRRRISWRRTAQSRSPGFFSSPTRARTRARCWRRCTSAWTASCCARRTPAKRARSRGTFPKTEPRVGRMRKRQRKEERRRLLFPTITETEDWIDWISRARR